MKVNSNLDLFLDYDWGPISPEEKKKLIKKATDYLKENYFTKEELGMGRGIDIFFKRFLELPENKQEEFYLLLREHLLNKYLTYDEMSENALFLLNNYPEKLGLFKK